MIISLGFTQIPAVLCRVIQSYSESLSPPRIQSHSLSPILSHSVLFRVTQSHLDLFRFTQSHSGSLSTHSFEHNTSNWHILKGTAKVTQFQKGKKKRGAHDLDTVSTRQLDRKHTLKKMGLISQLVHFTQRETRKVDHVLMQHDPVPSITMMQESR